MQRSFISVFMERAVWRALLGGSQSSQGFAREIMEVEMEWVFMKAIFSEMS